MFKHLAIMSLAIAVGLALGKMFGGSSLTSILTPSSTSTTTPCHVAAVVFGESFENGPRVTLVRRLLGDWRKSSRLGSFVVALYARHGARVAVVARRFPFVRRACTPVFVNALKKAQTRYAA